MSNELIKITDLTTQLGLSSRSLRYYEQIGLIQSVRPEFEKYRFYDSENIERLKQIIVLRKMQIPVRDILRIYESANMGVVVETFVNRIHEIDEEIGALAELKRITNEFLQTMLKNGVTKITALPILYEQMIQAIRFHQPIFWDGFYFPGRGAIKKDEQNRLTWIVGEKHLAVIINDEVRYCGANFPYMSLDLSREATQPIVIGAHGNDKIYFRSIRISQLAETQKNKLKEGELTMITKQSNNIIPVIHRLVTDEYGENYWFNGCAKYVMECLGEKDYDYWFFAGLTGDVFTQHYTYTKYSGDALSSYMTEENMGGNPVKYVEDTFAKCGYAATYVSIKDLRKNTEMYLNTLIAYIDKGIPVIAWGQQTGVYVGYEDYGKILLLITGNNNQPERIPLETALQGWTNTDWVLQSDGGWIFVGEKKEGRPLAQIYREAISAIPQHMSIKKDTHCFGSEAFRAWAKDIENGKFDGMKVEEFDTWAYHTNYVCVLATNGSCCHEFLKRARELNPDFGFLEEVSKLYHRTAEMWGGDNNRNDADSLEILGGGFNVTLEALQNKEKRGKIAAKIRECGDVTDEIVRVLNKNLKSVKA